EKMENYRPTRIAIIDNGIMNVPHTFRIQANGAISSKPLSQSGKGLTRWGTDSRMSGVDSNDTNLTNQSGHHKTLWDRIRGGRSFADDDFQLSPWMFASDPHGTQMANLICAIDPTCELYVAKVTDGRFGITPERVSRAIRWAKDMDVDIISMSFTILESSEGLKKSLSDAAKKDIILLCSAPDEGARVSVAWPAASDHTITIAACDEYGMEFRGMNSHYEWKLHGENIAAGTVPFLESAECVTGSSVATAIAAGLSSLVFSCYRLVHGMEKGRYMRMEIIKKHFQHMQSAKDSKYVLLEKFGNIDAKIREGEPIDSESIIKQGFSEIE
ncbi:uncharacterized protein TRIVIDRAFT_154318, partial [Trichoderma virens Gv29-8]